MNERREPTIAPLHQGDAPGTNKQATKAQPATPQTNRSPQPNNARPTRSTPPPVSGRRVEKAKVSFLAIAALFTALLACGGASYLYTQLGETQQLLSSATAFLEQSDKRIQSLEEKLALSGDESVQSIAVLQANIKTNTSEVKKLWAVAYDRNRKTIAENKATIAKLVKTNKSANKKLNNALVGLKADVSILNELMDAQQGVLAQVDQMSQSQTKSVSSLAGKLKALDKSLSKKVASNEDAIKAIDAFRAQVNREINRLKGV